MPYSDRILATSGLVSYWRLGDSTGTAVDSYGSNPGSYALRTNVTGALTADSNEGQNTQSGRYCSVTHSASLDITTAISLECWLYPTSNGNSVLYSDFPIWKGASNSSATNQCYGMLWYDNNIVFRYGYSTSSLGGEIGTTLSLNTWSHIVMTFDGRYQNLYVNGTLKSYYDRGSTITMNSHNTELRIGGSYGGVGNQSFPGYMDEVAIYNTVLTEQTAVAHYQEGVRLGFKTAQYAAKVTNTKTYSASYNLTTERSIRQARYAVQSTVGADKQNQYALAPDRAPTFVAAGAPGYSTDNTDSTGTLDVPAAAISGDLLIATIYSRYFNGLCSTPSGWTAIHNDTGDGSNQKIHAFWKRHSGSEPSNYTFSDLGSGGRTGFWLGIMTAWRNVTSSSPPFDSIGATQNLNNAETEHHLPGLDPIYENSTMVWFGGTSLVSGNPGTPDNTCATRPSNSLEFVNVQGTDPVPYQEIRAKHEYCVYDPIQNYQPAWMSIFLAHGTRTSLLPFGGTSPETHYADITGGPNSNYGFGLLIPSDAYNFASYTGSYTVRDVGTTLDVGTSYYVVSPQYTQKSERYAVQIPVASPIDHRASYDVMSFAAHRASYAINFDLEFYPIGSNSIAAGYAILDLVEEDGEDLFIKSPSKFYLTINNTVYRIPIELGTKLRGTDMIYTWNALGLYSGEFLFMQDLP